MERLKDQPSEQGKDEGAKPAIANGNVKIYTRPERSVFSPAVIGIIVAILLLIILVAYFLFRR